MGFREKTGAEEQGYSGEERVSSTSLLRLHTETPCKWAPVTLAVTAAPG